MDRPYQNESLFVTGKPGTKSRHLPRNNAMITVSHFLQYLNAYLMHVFMFIVNDVTRNLLVTATTNDDVTA
jgi:hypothetical protein